MIIRKTASAMLIFGCFLLGQEVAFGGDQSKLEEEYEQDFDRVDSMVASLSEADKERDLKAYEKFADDIAKKWRGKNRAYYTRLMLEICEPLSSGLFKESRQYELARKYVLSALEKPDEIPVVTELELAEHVTTVTRSGTSTLKEEEFAKMRKQDVAIRLHAWKRMIDAIDPKWDPEEVIWGGNVPPPEGVNLPPGVDPESIEDVNLRKKYEAAIEENDQKIQRYSEQHKLRLWMETFPEFAEIYIIQAYSHPPYNVAELEKSLDEYKIDENTKARILDAVKKNTREMQKE